MARAQPAHHARQTRKVFLLLFLQKKKNLPSLNPKTAKP